MTYVNQGTDSSAQTMDPGEDQILLAAVFAMLMRRRWIIAASALIPALIVVLSHLVGGKVFVAESTFVPQSSESDVSQYAGIAAQFGFSLPAGGGDESVAFYAALLRSPTLLREVATTPIEVRTESGTRRATFVELYDIEGDSEHERLLIAIDRLRDQSSVATDLEAGFVTVETSADRPEVAVQLNQRMLDLLAQFNLERRQSHASEERAFIEGRLAQQRAELLAAESEMERFLQGNRTYQGSPELSFQASRLQRTIELRQQVYNSLSQAYEQARIDEVRNTPVITVITPPAHTVHAKGGLVVSLLLATVLGGLFGIVAALVVEYVARERRLHPDAYRDLGQWLPGRRRGR